MSCPFADHVCLGLNHVYKDTTGFKYDIVLSRPIPRDNDNIVYERFRLMMFESNAGPYTYMTGIKYTRPGKPTAYIRNYLSPSEFCEAFNAFKRVFKQKTGIPWDKRLDGITVTSLEAAAGKDTSEETIAIDKIPFIYSPPARDLPRGDMPHNWKDPIEEAKKKEEAKRLASEMKIRAKNAKRAEAELKKLKALEEDAERMAKQIEEMERWSGSDDDSIGVSLETDDEDDSDDSSMETD